MKALLVDYGGVLTTSVVDSFAAFCETEGIDRDTFARALREAADAPDSPFSRIETGAITRQVFDVAVAGLLTTATGREIASSDLKTRLFAAIRPEQAMRDAVRLARTAGIRTALLSNSWGGGDYPPELTPLFDVMVFSGEVGMRKPNADIYIHTAGLLGTDPGACVFVDDIKTNVHGAESVGMTGILHREAARTIERLEEIFGVPLHEQAG